MTCVRNRWGSFGVTLGRKIYIANISFDIELSYT